MKLPQLESVVASTRTGAVLQDVEPSAATAHLAELAATLPEVFGTAENDCLERVALWLGAEQGDAEFAQVLLLSTSGVHVIHPLSEREDEALLASAPVGSSVGLVLSQVQARAAALGKGE